MPEEGKPPVSKCELQPAQGAAVMEEMKRVCKGKEGHPVTAMTNNKIAAGFHS